MGSEDPEGCACLPWHGRVLVLKKVQEQAGQDNFVSKGAWHMWDHMAAQEVEGPSVHHLTQQW